MAYTRRQAEWKNYPNTTTPIRAEDLNAIEDGLEDAAGVADTALNLASTAASRAANAELAAASAAAAAANAAAGSGVSRVALDVDGTPYFDTAGTTALSLDTDGVPYFI